MEGCDADDEKLALHIVNLLINPQLTPQLTPQLPPQLPAKTKSRTKSHRVAKGDLIVPGLLKGLKEYIEERGPSTIDEMLPTMRERGIIRGDTEDNVARDLIGRCLSENSSANSVFALVAENRWALRKMLRARFQKSA